MGFSAKLLAVLIVYFGGFATAIYALAPANPSEVPHKCAKPMSFPQSFTKSDQFALEVNQKMRNAAHKLMSRTEAKGDAARSIE
jgi:hypothetical protein